MEEPGGELGSGGPAGKPGWLSADRILGIVGGAMVMGALFLLVWGGEPDAGVASAPPPPLELVHPTDGAVVVSPLELHFRSGSSLSRGPGGWGTGAYHIHASIDGIEVMPGPGDLAAVGDGGYVWVLRGMPAGEVEVQLFWSDEQHRPIEGVGGDPVRVRVREPGEAEAVGAEEAR